MPINIPESLPARSVLEGENIFVMTEERAVTQDIRPLKIAILNLMPKKVETETQLLRLLSNSSIQINIELLQTASHTSKNTSQKHLLKFYNTFNDIKNQRFDGLIITGAPVEQIEYEDVDYWDELCEIMEWSKTNVFSTMHICWGAQAGLYYHYGIPKIPLEHKMFGIFKHRVLSYDNPLVRGFDEEFLAPHSRHTAVSTESIVQSPNLELLAVSEKAGPFLIASKDNRQLFITGHAEYDRLTLAAEYFRDLEKGLPIDVPYNYFPDNDPNRTPPFNWRSAANLIYANWLNYFIYQQTPFDLNELEPIIL